MHPDSTTPPLLLRNLPFSETLETELKAVEELDGSLAGRLLAAAVDSEVRASARNTEPPRFSVELSSPIRPHGRREPRSRNGCGSLEELLLPHGPSPSPSADVNLPLPDLREGARERGRAGAEEQGYAEIGEETSLKQNARGSTQVKGLWVEGRHRTSGGDRAASTRHTREKSQRTGGSQNVAEISVKCFP